MSKLEIAPAYSVGNIQIDFESLKKECRELVGRYKDLYIDETQVKEAKKDLADLRKKKKEINDQKIQIKKAYMKPFEDFEKGCKELIQIIDESVTNLDTQVKDYEYREKQQKRAEMELYWEVNGVENVPFEKVFDERLLNKSVTEKEWKQHFDEQHMKHTSDLLIIETLENEDQKLFVKADYEKTFNVHESLMNWKQYSERQAQIEAMKAQKQAQTKPEEPKAQNIVQTTETAVEQPKTSVEIELVTRSYTITTTEEYHDMFVKFLEDNNIDWLPF